MVQLLELDFCIEISFFLPVPLTNKLEGEPWELEVLGEEKHVI